MTSLPTTPHQPFRTSLLDLTDPRPIHFTGIAGAGMSGLAELLVRRGAAVQGTDANPDGAPDLVKLGVPVFAHDASLVARARAVVFTSAVPASHPELVAARALRLPVIRRAEALGEAVRGGTVIAVSGTHGKTTTTVMTTEALAAAGQDPTGIAGGRVDAWGSNLRAGRTDLYVVEADEYDRSFLALTPTVAVILNIEADHLDIYTDLNDINNTFRVFMQPARSVVLCADDAGAASLPQDATREIVRYSARAALAEPNALVGAAEQSASNSALTAPLHAIMSSNARLIAHNVQFFAHGSTSQLTYDGKPSGELVLRVPGLHNVRNALAALGAGIMVGARIAAMLPGLERFGGVERRFQRLGEVNGALLIDDYAHHPTEVAATIFAARAAYPERRLVIAFQPHLYSRTRDFAPAFGDALAAADVCLLCDIYPAREQPMAGVTSSLIADVMQTHGRAPAWRGPRAACAAALRPMLRDGDVVITMGAGDITRVGYELLGELKT